MSGCLSLAKLAASAGVSRERMLRYLTDFESGGIVERVGDEWRLTNAAVAQYALVFRAIRDGNVPLEAGDDDGLDHCKPGPRRAAA